MHAPYAKCWWRKLSSPALVRQHRACLNKIRGENTQSYSYKPAMCHQDQTERKEVTRSVRTKRQWKVDVELMA